LTYFKLSDTIQTEHSSFGRGNRLWNHSVLYNGNLAFCASGGKPERNKHHFENQTSYCANAAFPANPI